MTYGIEDFLNIKSAAVGNFSPDASKVLVHSNLSGTMQLYRVPREGGDLIQLTDEAEPVTGIYLPATDEIVLQKDEGGNERYQIYLLDDVGGALRPVVYDPEFMHRLGPPARDGKTIAYASNRRNRVDFDVYVRDLPSGDERCAFDRGGYASAHAFSPDGRYLSVRSPTDRPGDNQAFLIDLTTGEIDEVAPHEDEASVGQPHWTPDSSTFFFSTNTDRDFESLCRYDMRARTWERVIERAHDVACRVDWTGTHLLLMTNRDGYTDLELLDPATMQPIRELPLPRRGIATPVFSQDGRFVAYTFHSPVNTGDVFVFDAHTGRTARLTSSPNSIPEEEFVEPSVERFPSFDGEQIPAFVFRPRASSGDAPVVVSIHGGPESQYTPMFAAVTQYLLSRGYAVVAPNVRGSTGYGKRYEHLDDRRKRLDSVRDLAALHEWLRAQPGLDAAHAALMGGSYGGYMTLAGLAFQPELWAAGVDTVGISSLVTFLENTSAYRRRFREREYGWLDTDRDFLTEASPLTHVDRMRAPLFIIHGSNDPRVPLGEAEQIHRVLSGKGIPCELLVYPDEGHGLAKLKNRLDAYPKVADFLDRVLAPASR